MGAQTTQSSSNGKGGAIQPIMQPPAQGEPGQGSMPPGSPSGKGAPSQPQMMQPTPPGNAQNTITSRPLTLTTASIGLLIMRSCLYKPC